jgi:poly(A)-specific ribonuclease
MEVDKSSFNAQLLPILQHIANATYVTFDLEMSGITTRPRHSTNDRSHELGKPSLQEQYEEVKDAADTYQIVQVGITCVEEDREKGEFDR